jgi:glycosyltransferase involved in cell wall biosynthesis
VRVALVHDWLVGQRGGENVLLEMARLFRGAPIYTLVHRRGSVDPELEEHPIRTSFLQNLAGDPPKFRRYLPLFPVAVELWDLSEFDLILSTSHCVAKGVRVAPDQRHVAYVHTPMRYIWDQLPAYVPQLPGRRLATPAARALTLPLRMWDVHTGQRPTTLLANSHHVAGRIRRLWGREAKVVYPPVDVSFFAAAPVVERHGFLVVSALVPYKRVDVAVDWATATSQPLTVIGEGSERSRLEKRAGPTVRFEGTLDREEIRWHYAAAEALLFCGVEDFGIVPVEAMAAGCPVVALGQGGALETVGDAGVLFARSDVQSLDASVSGLRRRRANGDITDELLRAKADEFRREHFASAIAQLADPATIARP